MILATQRTGSTWLSDLLDSHPAISSYEELFLPAHEDRKTWSHADREFFDNYYARRATHHRPMDRTFWAWRYLEDLYAPTTGTDAVGMKLMYSQLKAHPWLLAYIVLRRVHVLHLVRANLLDIVLSQETARARSQFHALSSDVVSSSAVHLSPEMLVAELEALQRSVGRIRTLLRLLPAPSIEVGYEELTRGDPALDRVFRFLGVTPHPVTSRFAKLNRASKRTLIANYDDVERALRGTRFEGFLAG